MVSAIGMRAKWLDSASTMVTREKQNPWTIPSCVGPWNVEIFSAAAVLAAAASVRGI
jgi:hypothetical protein